MLQHQCILAGVKPVRFVKIVPGGGVAQSPIVFSSPSAGSSTQVGQKMALDVLIDSKTGKKIFKLTPSKSSGRFVLNLSFTN